MSQKIQESIAPTDKEITRAMRSVICTEFSGRDDFLVAQGRAVLALKDRNATHSEAVDASSPSVSEKKIKQFVRIKPNEPPEIGKGMIGIVLAHPFHSPGTEVATTRVLSIKGNLVETKSSIYEIVS